jgi:hypothetical protein
VARITDSSIGCRLCAVKRPVKRQQQIHKGICAVEAERVGWVKSFADPLRVEKEAVVKASLEFHAAYHYHGTKPRPQGSLVERMKWDEAIEALRRAERKPKEAGR